MCRAAWYALAQDIISWDCPYLHEDLATLTEPNAAIAVQHVTLYFASYICERSFTMRLDSEHLQMDLHSTVSAAREAATGYTQDIVMVPRAGMWRCWRVWRTGAGVYECMIRCVCDTLTCMRWYVCDQPGRWQARRRHQCGV